MARERGSPGFTLIEIIVVLAVLAIVAGLLAPMAFRVIQGARSSGAQDELQTLYRAIVGDQKQTFGYYGDVGAYPASLVDLVRPPAGVTGWKGPYLNVSPNPAQGGQITDPFGSPFEYYLVEQNRNLPDFLAGISRGPDGTSTNTSSTPNVSATFTGTVPTDNTYLSQPGNTDNLTFPALDSANNGALLQVSTIGAFAPAILNFDSNSAVNAFVPVCPGLFTLTLTSVPRGSADVRTNSVSPGMGFDLPQGQWTATLTSGATNQSVFTQTVVILPGATQAPSVNVRGGVDSSASTQFTLTVVNNFTFKVDVLQFTTVLGTVGAGTTATFSVNACAQVTIGNSATKVAVDQLVMPSGTFTVNEGNTSQQLTVCDDAVKPFAKVFQNGLQIGMALKKRCKTFTVRQGDTITLTNATGTVLQTLTMPGAATTVIL